MNQTVKTLVIVAAVGALAYLGYTIYKKRQAQTTVNTVAPPAPSNNPQTNTGIAGQIGNAAQTAEDLINSLDSVGDALGIG